MNVTKQRLMELAGIKKPLNEGYAWEREEGGALPTLASSIDKYNARVTNESVLNRETILNRIEELETQLKGLNYDNNGNAVDRKAFSLISDELDQLEGLLSDTVAAASEILSLLAHPDMKRSMDNLSDVLEDSEFMAIKKLYDGLYAELKKYE